MSTTTNPIFQAVHRGLVGQLRQVLEKGEIMKNLCECNEQRETPLQVAIRERKFEVIEFLVQSVKDHIQIDCHPHSKLPIRRMSPFSWDKINLEMFAIGPAEFGKEFTQTFVLPSADVAILRDMANRISIFKLMEYLIDVVDDDTRWFEFVLNSMVASSMDRAEKIIALELMGSAFILKIHLAEQFEPDEIAGGLRGLHCWRKALELRNSTANGRRLMPKIPHVLTSAARNALGDSVEVTTSEQLQELENQLRRRDRRSLITDQALLVIQRTFAQRKLAEPNLFHLKTLLDYGKQFKTTGDHFSNTEIHYGRTINISLMIMQQFNRADFPKCFQVFVEAFLLFSNVLIGLGRKTANNAERIKELTFVHVLEAIQFGFMIASNLILLPPICDQHYTWELLVMRKIYLVMVTLFKMPQLDPSEGERLRQVLGNFFRVEQLRNGFSSMLHLAVEGFLSARIDVTVRVEIVKFFLDNGADPKSLDRNGKSPLHILAGKCTPNSNEPFFQVFQAVLEAGGHLDQVTPDGKTVIAVLQEQKKHFQQSLDPRVDLWINTVMSLECYCAQKIRQENIPFQEDEQQLPLCLQQFIEQHSPLKGSLSDVMRLPPMGFSFPSGYQILQDSTNVSHYSVLKTFFNYIRWWWNFVTFEALTNNTLQSSSGMALIKPIKPSLLHLENTH